MANNVSCEQWDLSAESRNLLTYLRGTVDLGAIICEVVVGLFPAYWLQLLRQKEKFCKTNKKARQNKKHLKTLFTLLQFGLLFCLLLTMLFQRAMAISA